MKKILKSFEVTESSREDEFLHLVKVVDENNFDKIYDNFLQVLFTLFFVDCCQSYLKKFKFGKKFFWYAQYILKSIIVKD